mmetsp:Transcript_8042/g.21510  ORF Transcript_8042/g.21510 Transcript_8042/m.21510 type:complete len:208 (+) Transcript_8042:1970-2593(+)
MHVTPDASGMSLPAFCVSCTMYKGTNRTTSSIFSGGKDGFTSSTGAGSGSGSGASGSGSGSFFGDRFGGALGGGPFRFRAKACVPRMTSQCCSAPLALLPVPRRSATWSQALSPNSLTNSLREASSSSAHRPANLRFFAGGSSSSGSSGSGGSSYLSDSINSSHFASMTRADADTSDVSSLYNNALSKGNLRSSANCLDLSSKPSLS